MKLAIDRRMFLSSLEPMCKAISGKVSVPSLANVEVTASQDIRLVVTDLDTTMVGRIATSTISDPGQVRVNAHKLRDVIKAMSDGSVTLESDEFRLLVSGGASKFRLPLDSGDYPDVKPAGVPDEAVFLPASVIRTMLYRVLFATCEDASRYWLSGALIAAKDGRLEVVATDGHRLAYTSEAYESGRPVSLLVGSKLARLAMDVIGSDTVTIGQTADQQRVDVGSWLITSRRIEGQFPEYSKALSVTLPHETRVVAGELMAAIKRVSLISEERSRAIVLDIARGSITLSATSVVHGEATESVKAETNGDDASIVFNAQYLLDFCGVLEPNETVSIAYKDGASQAVFGPVVGEPASAYKYVVMPMRV